MKVELPKTTTEIGVGDIIMIGNLAYLIFEPKYKEYNLVSLSSGTVYFMSNQSNGREILNSIFKNVGIDVKVQVFSSKDYKLKLSIIGDEK